MADVVTNEVRVARIATGEIEEEFDPKHISTSYGERQNLSMHMRRFTELTKAFSKKVKNHCHALILYFGCYNFCRIHNALKVTPAMAAGLSETVRDMEWIVSLIDARGAEAGVPGPLPAAGYLKFA